MEKDIKFTKKMSALYPSYRSVHVRYVREEYHIKYTEGTGGVNILILNLADVYGVVHICHHAYQHFQKQHG